MMKCREPDYAGQYSPWSCETIGSYIGTKDAKPKDIMVPGAMEMMVSVSIFSSGVENMLGCDSVFMCSSLMLKALQAVALTV